MIKKYFFPFVLCGIISLITLAEEETKPDIFSDLKLNDRIEITLKNGKSFSGLVKTLTRAKITLDISYDDPDLKGTMTFDKKNIKDIKNLPRLDEAEKKRIISEKARRDEAYLKALKKQPPPGEEKPSEVTEPPTEKTNEEKEEERLRALLKKFPPEAGWNEARKIDISEKMTLARRKEEQEFLEVYNDWVKALELKAKEDRRLLLEKFPQEKGWGEEKYLEISTRIARIHVGPSAEEQEFINKYEDWKRAVEEKKAEEEAKKKKEEEENKAKEKSQKEEQKPTETPPAGSAPE